MRKKRETRMYPFVLERRNLLFSSFRLYEGRKKKENGGKGKRKKVGRKRKKSHD